MAKQALELQLLEQIVSATDERRAAEASLAALTTLVPSDYCSAAYFNIERTTFEMYRPDQGWLDAHHPAAKSVMQSVDQNPLANHYFKTRQSTVLFRSQIVADRDWVRTPYYNEFHRPLGIKDIGVIFLKTPLNNVVGLCCGRGRNFTERDTRPFHSLHHILGGLPMFLSLASNPLSPQNLLLASLTTREREILYWLREGKRNSEIATILGLSPHTVRHYLEKIYSKIGVETRVAAALVQVL